ncbi:hypothetical protein CUN60_10940 [Aquella oligotrophica]|uniref:Uncharacterized protein n=1 Tax=Aquella oligotrophica TaxID=2067065 RepID=A0A2I7N972_9NEIS|nr:hypothetical protein CUN60_10940 [Aquella oligotrophica]
MKYLRVFEWRSVSAVDYIATTNNCNFEYTIRVVGYRFQLRIRATDHTNEICREFNRLHDAMQFAYEHYWEQINFNS